ncbi:MAG: SusD/RagB family nutrient-binding outer membrane lipoprotein [Chitinophagaceae bacterium]|nr:MAG: SusD/RagB family nutrient-binding outer membrane lipoprotein [Chitinophagaceae bacterium]
MKKLKINLLLAAGFALAVSGCKKFDEINTDPIAANTDQVQVEYFINNSIIGAQQDPHIAERVFVLYWKTAARHHLSTGIAGGSYDDGWSGDYYSNGYMSGWLNHINTAIQVANEKIAAGKVQPYTANLLQVARIWRVYLMSEMTDNFGPIPINAFQGQNPNFASVKDVYYHMLDELKDASGKLDVSVINPDVVKKQDPAYGYDYNKWRRYANSLRLRLAMRLSEVDAGKAKPEFEAAAAGELITEASQNFQVQERSGWDPLSGVMSREWNSQILSGTLKNLYVGLGGVTSQAQLPATFHSSVKPADWAGIKYDQHFATATNEPFAGYWLDGLPSKIDPRAYKAFPIPGDFSNPEFSGYPTYDNTAETPTASLNNVTGTGVFKTINATNTYNAFTVGDWGAKGSRNTVRNYPGTMPRLAQRFRGSAEKRIFFANWETYFLLAEAAVKGWTVPVSAQVAYENGVKASFDYWGVGSHAANYLASEDYNNAGTSAKFTHTAEPPASRTMRYKDGYTDVESTVNILYPTNTIYKNGAVKNDQLTKIITQKYIAQVPWLPLEAWNDHRRLGLPFFENVAVENPLPNLPALTQANMMTNQVKFYPQRLRYPSSLRNSSPKGYTEAVSLLGGPDEVLTPLWWAKK